MAAENNSSSIVTRLGAVLLASALSAAIVGCSKHEQTLKDRAIISGVVIYDGKPLPAGTITFQAADGTTTTAVPIREGGKYSTPRAPLGKNAVSISTISVQYGNPAAYVAIPDKYGDPKLSGLTTDVQAGTNQNVDFNLAK